MQSCFTQTKVTGIFLLLFAGTLTSAKLRAQSIEIRPLPAWKSETTGAQTASLPKIDFAADFQQGYQGIDGAEEVPLQDSNIELKLDSTTPSTTNLRPANRLHTGLDLSKNVEDQTDPDPDSSSQLPLAPTANNDFPIKSNSITPFKLSSTASTTPGRDPSIETFGGPDHLEPLGIDTSPTWWKQKVVESLNFGSQTRSVDTNSLVFEALKNSPRIQAISQTPMIRELQVVEADADFDPISFVRSNFDDRNDPVGNTLTTGGAPFLKDHIWSGEFGLRKKTRTGATIQASERLGFKNSNSTFFVPQDQGTATLALNVTQPLLRGRGRFYNQSQILIAQATGGAAWDTFSNELQDELQSVAQAYWHLYYDRSLYLQKKRNVERGEQILAMLEARSEFDSIPSQIARASSAVQSRRTDLANALRDVRNSETEIRRLIADRQWLVAQEIEMIPMEQPLHESLDLPLDKVVYTALEQRREIKEAMQRAKIAGVQTDISANELLPELSLLLGTYVSGLKGGSAIGQAMVQQFDVVPGYNVGIQFEMPYQNRAARSRLAQRKLQLAKIKAEIDEVIQKVIAESQIALRRVNSALETIIAAEQAIVAARADLEQNQRRWETFGLVEGDLADGQNPTTMLNQVLDSQERLTAAELVYSQTEFELKDAEVALRRTMGTLLMHENIEFGMAQSGYNPQMYLDKQSK